MKRINIRNGLLGSAAIFLASAGTAFAGGTDAETTVSNTFTLDYKVSTVSQTQIDNTAAPTEFTVDRLVDLTVASSGDTNVAPGAQNQDLVFSLTNDGNDTQAYDLSFVNEGSDDFSATSVSILYYIDDGDNAYEPDGDDGSAITYNGTETPDLLKDRRLWVVLQSNIPASLDDADVDNISLVADTLEPSTSGDAGDPVVADANAVNSMTGDAENVLADGSGTSNEAANAGDHSATAAYVVASADIAATKAVTVFSEDGTGCATIPGTPPAGEQYAIPGSCVEYTITINNTGGTDATDLIVNDILPSDIEFVAATTTGFTGGGFATPALPAANTDCTGGACEINFAGATLANGSVGTPTTGVVTIRALVK